jgi:undecaprenyl-diphosphatase
VVSLLDHSKEEIGMMTYLQELDVMLFFFVNHTLGNPVFDLIMPVLTDLNKIRSVQALVILGIAAAMIKGGRRARLVCILLIVTITCSDQFSSFVIKPFFGRLRPCVTLADVRTFVGCGSGYSFPSSHAVNNFAAASVLAYFYRRYAAGFFAFAALIAFTRVYVGVHYPSDIAGGALIGTAVGFLIIGLWSFLEKQFHLGKTEILR